MDKTIKLYELKELYKINPDISAGDLITLAEQYVELCPLVAANSYIKNCGETITIKYNASEVENG
jgi:hypothetical protein